MNEEKIKLGIRPPTYKKIGYIKFFDGLRAFSIAIVFMRHLGAPFVVGGFGVTVFFYISGFLITKLLLEEAHESTLNNFSLKNFYKRRFFRLMPALWVFLIIVITFYYFYNNLFNLNEVVAAYSYFYNYYLIYASSLTYPAFLILWSLAVEEHFYLFYPLILKKNLSKLSFFIFLLCLFIAAILLWKIILFSILNKAHGYLYYATDTKIDMLLYGSIFALILHKGTVFKREITFFANLFCVLISLFLIFSLYLCRSKELVDIFGPLLLGPCFSLIMCYLICKNDSVLVTKILENKLVSWVGKLSYSIYLWHCFCIYIASLLVLEPSFKIVFAIILTLAISSFSYYVVEKRFIVFARKHFR